MRLNPKMGFNHFRLSIVKFAHDYIEKILPLHKNPKKSERRKIRIIALRRSGMKGEPTMRHEFMPKNS